MNLQQLNGSGQSVRKFVLTALIALIVTGSTWYIAELVNSFRNWQRKRNRTEDKELAPKYSVAERVAMIVWLVREGHRTWMTDTGAWSRILCNSRKPFRVSQDTHLSVGELVSLYSLGEAWFDIEDCAPDE